MSADDPLLPSPLQVVDRLVSRADVQLTAAPAAGEGSPGDTSRGPGGVLMVLGKRFHVVNSALMLLKVRAGHCVVMQACCVVCQARSDAAGMGQP
jgi:hypothetical protein